MNEPLQISDKARETAKKEVGPQNSRDFWTETLSTAPKQGHFVQQLLDEETERLETELQEAQKERDQLRQQLDIHAYEFKQLRDELECDGSDLPQLLAKIQLIRQQLTEAKEIGL